jgi:beta-lactamase regulating signal transducer with metallopeptidase domain
VDDVLNIGLSNALVAMLLAVIAIVVGMIYRRPALMHGLWLLVLLKLVTPPLVRIPIAWSGAPESGASEAAAAEEPPPAISPLAPEEPARVFLLFDAADVEPAALEPPTPTAPEPAAPPDAPLWPRVLPVLWLTGSLGWYALALWRLRRFCRLLRYARPAPAALQHRVRRLSRRLGLRQCPHISLLPGRLAPMVWSIGGPPRLLVPAGLVDTLGDEQLDTLLVHELAHLRRRDHWVRALEFVVLGLYWWHPVVWYARRELREAEEQCCDAWVVSTLPGAGRTYATALVDTLDFLSTAHPAVPPLASGLGQVTDLKRRLTMIMRGTTPRALGWPGSLAVIGLGALLLPAWVQAQTPNPKPKPEPKDVIIEKVITVKDLDIAVEQTDDLEKAKAELAALEAKLKEQIDRVEKAKADLRLATEQLRVRKERLDALKRDQAKAQHEKRIIALDIDAKIEKLPKDADAKKTPRIRIEITFDPDMKADQVKEVLRKIESVIPQKHRTIVIGAGAGEGIHLRLGDKAAVVGEKLKALPPSPQLGRYVPAEALILKGAISGPQDKRISELEAQLKKVLAELQELRKEMKKSRRDVRPPEDEPSRP